MIDYQGESKSKYEIWRVLGWPFETGVALSRFIFLKIMDTYPKAEDRLAPSRWCDPVSRGPRSATASTRWACPPQTRTTVAAQEPGKRPFDYFKDFYADTAIKRRPCADGLQARFLRRRTRCYLPRTARSTRRRPGYIRSTIAVLETLDLTPADREKISYRNAQALFGVK